MAVAQRRVLDVRYQKADGERSDPRLHPHALVQRGPVIYLVALKNEEPAHVRFYALHRMLRADLTDEPARVAEGFDLDQAIEHGLVDFGPGKLVALELRVRGYLADILEDCPLAQGQMVEWEAEDSAFTLRLRAQVPLSGALFRWLMAAGDKVEVVAPPALRHAVAVQAAKTASLYASATDWAGQPACPAVGSDHRARPSPGPVPNALAGTEQHRTACGLRRNGGTHATTDQVRRTGE